MHIKPRRKLCDPKNEILGASILVLKVVVRSAFQFIIRMESGYTTSSLEE